MHNTDPWSGSTLTGAGMAGDQPCATTGTIHGRGSDELMTSRCVQGGLRIGGAQAATLHFLFNVGRPWGPGSRPVGLGSQSIVCRGDSESGLHAGRTPSVLSRDSSLIASGDWSLVWHLWGSRGSWVTLGSHRPQGARHRGTALRGHGVRSRGAACVVCGL